MASRGMFEMEPEIEGATVKIVIERSDEIDMPEFKASIKIPAEFNDADGRKILDQLESSTEAAQMMGMIAMVFGDKEVVDKV